MSEYILGTSDHELARLGLQQEVWGEVTAGFLDALGPLTGQRVLDVGCGPGFVLEMLHGRVGVEGSVLGLDESQRWIDHCSGLIDENGWRNVNVQQARIEDVQLEPASFDLVFLRWVLAFLPDRDDLVRKLAGLLRPGGVVAVMDYNHEGVSLFPESAGFRAAIRAVRAFYETRGGNTWVMGEITGLFRRAGLETVHLSPTVLGGGPDSPAFRWAHAFFPFHVKEMTAGGLMTEEEAALFLKEWEEHRANPDALFFSPIVVSAAGRKP